MRVRLANQANETQRNQQCIAEALLSGFEAGQMVENTAGAKIKLAVDVK